jgi:hypothetical protein
LSADGGTRAFPAGAASLLPLAVAAFLWGVAEATYFFVVADVLLTFVALRFGLRAGLAAALAAAVGAALGGLFLWSLARHDPDAARAFLATIPFLAEAKIAAGLSAMSEPAWPLAMLKGSFIGIPYKVFAAGAGMAGIGPAALVVASVPIRLVRFAIAVGATRAADRILARRLRPATRALLLALAWILFYGEFWFRWYGLERFLNP